MLSQNTSICFSLCLVMVELCNQGFLKIRDWRKCFSRRYGLIRRALFLQCQMSLLLKDLIGNKNSQSYQFTIMLTTLPFLLTITEGVVLHVWQRVNDEERV